MTPWFPRPKQPWQLSRRRFVQGLAAGGVLAATPSWLQAAVKGATALGSAPVLSGREIDLVIAETPVNFTGVTRMATTINGSIPAPTLRLREGDDVTIRVTNRLPVATSIHWHGILLPYQMDGVPGISYPGIAPGETFVYRFTLRQSGTYWYHSHSGFQEMTGMYGALIIEPRAGERHRADQDYVVQLSDWTDEDPMRAFSKLKVQSDVYNFNQSTFFDFTDDVSKMGLQAALEKRQMWNQMRMSPTDLADLSAATFTFLMYGTTPAGNWNGLFQRGDRVRLRFINAASNSRPLVVLANLSGFDGSPESLREWQLEFGAEIGRAVVNFKGPIVFCVISRYHGGAFVVFSNALNDNMEVAALEGSYASVIGGAPAAAVVFAREVKKRTESDPRLKSIDSQIAQAAGAEKVKLRAGRNDLYGEIYSEMLGQVAEEFDGVHSVQRALEVGSVNRIIPPAQLRPYLIEAVERGMRRELERELMLND